MVYSPGLNDPSDAQRRANNRTRLTGMLASVSMLTLGLTMSAAAMGGTGSVPTVSPTVQAASQLPAASGQSPTTGSPSNTSSARDVSDADTTDTAKD